MPPITAKEFLPVELVFNPNWWYHTAGISFDESFYLDRETRIQNDVTMRRVLYERYGEMGPGVPPSRLEAQHQKSSCKRRISSSLPPG